MKAVSDYRMSRLPAMLCFTLALTAAIASAPAAEGLRTLPDSAEAMGMLGGRFTLLDDASVARTNPASLTEIHDTLMTFTYQPWHGETDFRNAAGVQDSMVRPWKHTGSLYLAHPVNDRLTAGMGVSAPFGISINWPREGAFRYTGAYDAELQTFAITPSLGLKINDSISLGAGLDIYRSKLRLEQRFPWAVVTGLPLRDGDFVFDGTGWGLGAYAGMRVEWGGRHHFGLVGRLPVTVDYEGDSTISNVPVPGLAANRTAFASQVEHPGSIGAGYGFDFSERPSDGIDFEWIQNSTHDDIPLAIGPNQPLLGGRSAVPLGWDDSISISVGGES